MTQHSLSDENDIAIIGMAAHLPGAATTNEFWTNLCSGVESIRQLTPEELVENGEARHLLNRPDYVAAAATLDGFENFDAEFFGLSPKEAAIMDPQHRQFLEVSWEALENAGHPPEKFDGPIGVFAGCGMGSYFYFNICSNPDLIDDVGMFLLRHTGNDKDFLSTRVSHFLDLKGPSINLQTACSTSLVATHYASQALMMGECNIALAGGVTVEMPHGRGYVYKEGEVLSPDGHCHAFDHRAQGTVFGSGAGVIVLRRLGDAIADGDHIWAIIKGSAVNNDGAAKAGYLAPSVDGQAAAVAEAQLMAGISADTIDYIECHGTGTYLGDPIEIAALTQAFSETTDETGFCRIGSVKTNIGHLDTAAGVASLIKTSLSLHHRQIPPSLGFEKPNPAIDFENSPFVVNDKLTKWVSHKGPRRGAVNSLGVGGTNAHTILQEAPERAPSGESDWPFQLLTISGRTKGSLEGNSAKLVQHLRNNPNDPLADIAWTLKQGRREFERRRVVVAETHEDAANLLEENDPRRVFTHTVVAENPEVVFMFPGGGAQYAGMARDLYETEPTFAEWMDRGLEILQSKIDYDIRELWLSGPDELDAANELLKKPSKQLPLIMIVEYALAQLWMSWGVKPTALVGHSMGENTAACLAGIISFEDCIGLVHLRGSLFDTVPAGGMLSVALPADQLEPYLGDDLDLGAVNSPSLSIATGAQNYLDILEKELKSLDIDCQRIPIDIAAHSRMLEPILAEFGDYLRSIPLDKPKIPLASNITGNYITDDQAMDPEYWVEHLRGTVRFADCIGTLAKIHNRVFIEVGPGVALVTLAGQHNDVTTNQVIGTLRHQNDTCADDAYFLAMLGRYWAVGGTFDWAQYWGEAVRNRLPLPTYAFQRAAYFVEPGKSVAETQQQWLIRSDDPSDWVYRPSWRPTYAACEIDVSGDLSDAPVEHWLIFADAAGLTDAITSRLRSAGHTVTTVTAGDTFARTDENSYVIAPERGRESYDALVHDLMGRDLAPTRIVHGWLVTSDEIFRPGSSFFHRNLEQGFYSLLFLAQAIGDAGVAMPMHLNVLTSGAAQVRLEPLTYPEKSTVMGPARVIPREFPGLSCSTLDIALPENSTKHHRARKISDLANSVLEDLFAPPASLTATLRDGKRFEQHYSSLDLPQSVSGEAPLRRGGTYLVTGGFGGIGMTLAKTLIEEVSANIVLLARSRLPPRRNWVTILNNSAPTDPRARKIRALMQLEAAGGTVKIVYADVSNVEDMQAARANIEKDLGPIHGVIHAAGTVADGLILTKSMSEIEDVFSPKIYGTQVLDKIFPDGDLDWLVLLSSTSTASAPVGQVDYVAANEYLNAYAKARVNDKTKVMAINWGIWSDVGMAADAMLARTGNTNLQPANKIQSPMLDEATFDSRGNRLFTARYSTTERWFLNDHRTKAGDALLPGTGYLELVAQALRAQGEYLNFEIQDMYFLRPLSVPDLEPRDIRVMLPRSDTGYSFSVESRTGETFEQNAHASLSLLPLSPPAPLDIDAINARCAPAVHAPRNASIPSCQEEHLLFGQRWQVLQSTAFGTDEGIATLKLPDAASGDIAADYHIHPGLMDIATGWAMNLIKGYQSNHLWVPVSYRSVRVYRALPEKIVSWVRSNRDNQATGKIASFDITVAAPDGSICIEIEDFSMQKMENVTGFGASAKIDSEQLVIANLEHRPLSPAEERLRHNLTQGIRAEEGAALFLSTLNCDLPQVILSSLEIDALITQAEESGDAPENKDQKFQRPELFSDYVAPDNAIEKRLAGFWQDLLGVDQIGAEDSFFDLGGHSLIAVRLFAQIRKSWQVDFPISVLFEAPTIRKCAQLIAARGVSSVDDEVLGNAKTIPNKSERRFTYLVPMHSGEGGPKTPFFLVAGMFGNVLNLRHLAHLIGTDRPFYGLQARGLFGDEEPHHSITAAARDYIAEMRQVQPKGPYFIGGFSGGGITAYEIAFQLNAVGESVSALVMLDTPLPVRAPLSRRDRIMINWLNLKNQGIGYVFKWAAKRIEWERTKRNSKEDENTGDGLHFHDTAIEFAFLENTSAYQVMPWSGPLSLFRPPLVEEWEVAPGRFVDRYRHYIFPDNEWARYASQINVYEVPGDHDSMVLEPNVRVLATRIKNVLETAETQFLFSHKAPVQLISEAAE